MRFFLALDGTKDVTQATRCRMAARLGRHTAICVLPPGQDPDDLAAGDWETLKREARPVLAEWLTWLDGLQGAAKETVLAEFKPLLIQWAAAAPALVGETRAAVCSALNLNEAEYSSWLGEKAAPALQDVPGAAAAAEGAGEIRQPEPLRPIGDSESRELSNYEIFERPIPEEKQTRGGPKSEKVAQKIPLRSITEKLLSELRGWPARLYSPGAAKPVLFTDVGEVGGGGVVEAVENGAEVSLSPELAECKSRARELLIGREEINRIKFIGSVEQMRRWLHRNFKLKFKERLDCHGANFVGFNDLYHDLGGIDDVAEYRQVETRPHCPPITGHFYAYTARDYLGAPAILKYGNGCYLEAFLDFFNNTKDTASKAILAAAIVTPGWGGLKDEPYGLRPAFVITAPDRGYGKTTIAEMIAFLWGGHLSINYEQRNEEELFQRLLSVEALLSRVVIVDNVKGTFASSTIEGLITAKKISGKRLYHGEATRPNTLTYFVTANSARMGRDMALRSYFIELTKPEYRTEWNEALAEFLVKNWRNVLADVRRLLTAAPQCVSKRADRWGPWRANVLTRVCDWLNVAVDEVVEVENVLRAGCDDDLRESKMLVEGVVEKLCWREKLIESDYVASGCGPNIDRFVASSKLCEWFRDIMNKPNLGTKQVVQIIDEHLGAGRLQQLRRKRTSAANGYEISEESINEFLKEKLNADKQPEVLV